MAHTPNGLVPPKKIIVFLLILLAAFAPVSLYAKNMVIDSAMSLKEAMAGLNPGCPEYIKTAQALVPVRYYSFDHKLHQGQIVVDQRLQEDIIKVFEVILEEKFPVQSVIPISHERFSWQDEVSMKANNTSAFNYRETTGAKKLSNHAYGFAVDINPAQNPYIKGETTLPEGASYDVLTPGTLTEDSPVVKIFLKLGWQWGGHWETLKDYQHFEKVLD